MPNHTLPEFLHKAPELIWIKRPSGSDRGIILPAAAKVLFFNIWQVMDNHHRHDIGLSPSHPCILRAACHPSETWIRIPDVARSLNQLEQSGAVVISDSDRGWYVEVAEQLRYRREDYKEGQPKYGPRTPPPAPPPPEQGALPFSAVPALPRRRKTVEQAPGVPHGQIGIQMDRLRSPSGTDNVYPEGKRARCAIGLNGKRIYTEEETAAARAKGFFAKDASTFPNDPVWADVVRELGEEEMFTAGSKWALRYASAAPDLGAAHRNWREQPPEKRTAGNFGAYLEDCWQRMTGEMRRAS